jgi:hypothetical protein
MVFHDTEASLRHQRYSMIPRLHWGIKGIPWYRGSIKASAVFHDTEASLKHKRYSMIPRLHWGISGIRRVVFSGNPNLLCYTKMFPSKTVSRFTFQVWQPISLSSILKWVLNFSKRYWWKRKLHETLVSTGIYQSKWSAISEELKFIRFNIILSYICKCMAETFCMRLWRFTEQIVLS